MNLKQMLATATACAVISTSLLPTAADAAPIDSIQVDKPVKNVIMMVPDGCATDAVTLTRWYNGNERLNLDPLASGMVLTYSADAPIADSAPAGTAMATGHKSHTGFVGVLPDQNTMPGMAAIATGDARKPVANILEGAKTLGKATGIIATSELMHATPAAFSAHDPSRKNYDNLSEQQVYQGMDVVLGGGYDFYSAAGRKDGTDLIPVIEKDYQLVRTKAEMDAVTSGKIWGLFAGADMAYEMDRSAEEPSLADMTQKAIDLLSQDEDGFFLMVEGSKVDWAAHANDPIGLISDINAFDDAVGVAVAFAQNDGNTLVISATDHANSGISIGDRGTSDSYDKEPLATFIDPLQRATATGEGIGAQLNDDRSNVADVMAASFGITDLSEEEIAAIKDTETGDMNSTVGPMIAARAHIGFTTNGHTGGEVPYYVYNPTNISQLTGVIENTDINRYMSKALGLDLADLSNKLFVSSRPAFTAKGAEVHFDTTDDKNPQLKIVKGDTTLVLPINTNKAILNGEEKALSGVIVFNGINTYVPQDAVDLIA